MTAKGALECHNILSSIQETGRPINIPTTMGDEHCSKSPVQGSKSITFGVPNLNPTPPGESSLLSPLSDHSTQQHRSPVEMLPVLLEHNNELDSNYFVYSQLTGSDASMEKRHAGESGDELVSSESSEYIYDGFFDWTLESHFYCNNNTVMEARPAAGAGAGGISATFGIPLRPASKSGYQYPTEQFMIRCRLCCNFLYGEQKEIFIYKGEYAFCSQKCREVEIGYDEFKEKAETKTRKESKTKRLENIGKFPVVFGLGPSA